MSEGKEILFTQQELKEMQDVVLRNPYFQDPRILHIPKYPTDVQRVSPIHGLIFAKGNEYTGFEHIFQRHEQWTSKANWIESQDENGNNYFRLQNQGLFRIDSMPIFDYCDIADSLYKHDNLNIEKNKRPELFEMYTGEHTHKDYVTSKYNLFLYKGTKVVHTLYPQSNKNNPKRIKGFNYTRGGVSGSWDMKNSIAMIDIPYLNHQEIIKYVLIFRRDFGNNIEIVIVQVNDNYGNPWKSIILGTRDIVSPNIELNPIELTKIQYADLRELEKIILEIEEQKV